MRSYSLLAAAKVNLYLEILGDRPDGYHELVMVLQSIDLADQIDIRSTSTESIFVHCNHPEVPSDQRNLAYRAAQLMTQQFPDAFARFGGVEITVQKHIPVGAGLAGGSTNAASVLVGMDLLWQLGLTLSELQDLGAQLGSDVPFCIAGGTVLATGRGEQLNPLPTLDSLHLVLAKYRGLAVSTAWAYQTFRQQFHRDYVTDVQGLDQRRHRVHSGPMVAAIAHRDPREIGQLLYNDLERVVLPTHPQVQHLRDQFQQAGTLGTMMSGSGPTVFALAESQAHAQQIRDFVRAAIPDPDLDFWIVQGAPSSIRIISSV